MKRLYTVCLVLAGILALTGIILDQKARAVKAEHDAYGNAAAILHRGMDAVDAGKNVEASAALSEVSEHVSKHAGDARWESLGIYQTYGESVLKVSAAEESYRSYAISETQAPKDRVSPPDPKMLLEAYRGYQATLERIGQAGIFANSDVAWKVKNEIGTALFWQLVFRWSLENASFDDIKPIYDPSVAAFKAAKALSESASVLAPSPYLNPERYVTQNLDYMTRLGDALSPQQSQPQQGDDSGSGQGDSREGSGSRRRGLGDFLSRAQAELQKGQPNPHGLGKMLSRQDLGPRFLPLPMKGIGSSRINGGVK